MPWLPSTVVADQKHKRGSGIGLGVVDESSPSQAIAIIRPLRKFPQPSFVLRAVSEIPKMMGEVESIVWITTSLTSHLSPDGTTHHNPQVDAGERKSPCSGQSAFSG